MMLAIYLIVGNFKAVQGTRECFCFLSLKEVSKASGTVFFRRSVFTKSPNAFL